MMNMKKKIVLGLGIVLLGSSPAWAGKPWHGKAHGRPDVVVIERHDHWRHHRDYRPVTVVREKTVVHHHWAPPPRVVEYRYARPYYGPGVTIDVSPIFIPFR
jgi:hypothetical protein